MICLPLYVPHVGQTRCGTFGSPHFGHLFVATTSAFIAPRRLRRRCFETFLFGTAMYPPHSDLSRRNAAHRGSNSSSSQSHEDWFKFVPQRGQKPRHASSQITNCGTASRTCS